MAETKKVLFIGDSITEWGRFEDEENLGQNYVRIIHDYLKVTYPDQSLQIVNKGIGGDRVTNLAERWEEDVIAQNPDIVSISVGINDVWRQVDGSEIDQVYPEQFEQLYDDLLTQLKTKTNATIVLMEPTVIEEDAESKGNQLLIPYVEAVHRLAEKYETLLVPTHEVFLDYLQKGDYPLTIDGVHMNPAGNTLMAIAWMKTAGKLFE